MISDLLHLTRPAPVDQLRACANLVHLLRHAAEEEEVLRRNGVRITPQLCLDVMTEFELVARHLPADLARDLRAAADRFADTTTTTGAARAPNPDIGRNLRFGLGIAAHLVEALSTTLMTRTPGAVAEGRRILDTLRDARPFSASVSAPPAPPRPRGALR